MQKKVVSKDVAYVLSVPVLPSKTNWHVENPSSPKTGCPDHPGFPWSRSANCQVEAQIEQEQHDAAMVRQRREMQRQIEAFHSGEGPKETSRMEDGRDFQHVMMQN